MNQAISHTKIKLVCSKVDINPTLIMTQGSNLINNNHSPPRIKFWNLEYFIEYI
jgi:hypothetical protein